MGETAEKALIVLDAKGARPAGHGLSGVIDVVLFLAILLFSAAAMFALALAAPLAIAATAIAGALSALTARGARRGGWRAAGA